MTLSLRGSDRHADRVLDVVRNGLQKLDNNVIQLSWRRCVNEYRLHSARPGKPTIITRAALESRCARWTDVIGCARHEMTTLHLQLGDMESAVLLTDNDGLIVHMVLSPEVERVPLGLRTGGMWSEVEDGTNGMGACLTSAYPVSIRREDHFFSEFTHFKCWAVSVFDPSGEITVVLDVTSRSRLMQQHLLVLLGMTARMIENRLVDQRLRKAYPPYFNSRPEFIYTLDEGKLAVGDGERVLAANRSALFQLGLQSMEEIRSRSVEDLFQSSLEDILQRSSSSFYPVVTYRANAALRFFAAARLQASDSAGPMHFVPSPGVSTASRGGLHARPAAPTACTLKDAHLIAHLETARRVIVRETQPLLCGETGSDKEVFVRAMHSARPHAHEAFAGVNCASIHETLTESEFFGYRAVAFTDAQRTGRRRGKILQANLLRVLDERQVTPLGTEDTHPVNFQLISASHQHLLALVQEGRFREDLYCCLAGIELQLLALRDRTDKRDLITYRLAAEADSQDVLSADAEHLLLQHAWPGSIRQLRHVLRCGAGRWRAGQARVSALVDRRPSAGLHASSCLFGSIRRGDVSTMRRFLSNSTLSRPANGRRWFRCSSSIAGI